MSKKLTLETFIEKSKKVHLNRYDYSKFEYINYQTKSIIICPIHGEFLQNPNNHLNGKKCHFCANNQTSSIEKFIERALVVHKNKYSYNNSIYINSVTKLEILCKSCNKIFWQTPNTHLRSSGCKTCGYLSASNLLKLDLEEFKKRVKEIHYDKYDYNLISDLKNCHTKVKIFCKKCSNFFYQTPNHHLRGRGCKKCGKEKSSSLKIKNIKDKKFNRLIAKKIIGRKDGLVLWECACDCGNVCNVVSTHLIQNVVKSCGCLSREKASIRFKKLSQRQKGENHPCWNPNLTQEEREYARRGVGEWSKIVKEKNNYTCQLSGKTGGELESHHLYSWDKYKELRFDIDNGITLSKDIHNLFHTEYGWGNNTVQQFEEFVKRYNNGEFNS